MQHHLVTSIREESDLRMRRGLCTDHVTLALEVVEELEGHQFKDEKGLDLVVHRTSLFGDQRDQGLE